MEYMGLFSSFDKLQNISVNSLVWKQHRNLEWLMFRAYKHIINFKIKHLTIYGVSIGLSINRA